VDQRFTSGRLLGLPDALTVGFDLGLFLVQVFFLNLQDRTERAVETVHLGFLMLGMSPWT
jgi:hypothetical protein